MQTVILTSNATLHCRIRCAAHGRLSSELSFVTPSPIRNGDTVEIVLSEDVGEEESLKLDWRFATTRDNQIIPKYWGARYPLSCQDKSVKLHN